MAGGGSGERLVSRCLRTDLRVDLLNRLRDAAELVAEVTRMLGHMQLEDLEPDLVTCNSAMTAFENGRFQKAMEVFQKAVSWSLKPNEITCNALLTSCSTGNSWTTAMELYSWMKASAVETNIISHDMALLSCCAGGQTKLAINVLHSVQQQYSSVLTVLNTKPL